MDNNDKQVEAIIEGLTGVIRIGQKYYFFVIPYHYIGTVTSVDKDFIVITDAEIVMNAGSDPSAVSKILAGSAKPEVSEKPNRPIIISRSALSAAIPFKK